MLDKPGKLTDEEMAEIRQHPRLGYDALAAQGGFPPEMLDVVLHHHEFLDGSGYPNGLSANQISDIVRLTTIVDIYAALVEKRAYRMPFTHSRAFTMMEGWAASSTSSCCRCSARWRSGRSERRVVPCPIALPILNPRTTKSRSGCRPDPGNRPSAACRGRPAW